MPGPDVSDPAYWQWRAAAVRKIAASVEDSVLRRHLERLAVTYDEIADLAKLLPPVRTV
ncbi:MAG TPA: hypothetical protein VL966_03060 [Alphaproteobacteria bacterium]|nr:hypothetical protein [Alphaproteobacteria bacterium]